MDLSGIEELMECCHTGDHKTLKRIIDSKPRNRKKLYNHTYQNYTPLQACIKRLDVIGVKMLLKTTIIDIFETGHFENSPLTTTLNNMIATHEKLFPVRYTTNAYTYHPIDRYFKFEPYTPDGSNYADNGIIFEDLLREFNISLGKTLPGSRLYHVIFEQMLHRCVKYDLYYGIYLLFDIVTHHKKFFDDRLFMGKLLSLATEMEGDPKIWSIFVKFDIVKHLDKVFYHKLARDGNVTILSYLFKQCTPREISSIFVRFEVYKTFSSLIRLGYDNIIKYLLSFDDCKHFINKQFLFHEALVFSSGATKNYFAASEHTDIFLYHGNKTPLQLALNQNNIQVCSIIRNRLANCKKSITVLIEKYKYITKNIANTVCATCIQFDSRMSIGFISKNLDIIWNTFRTAGRFVNFEIKTNSLESGSGVLRSWLNNVSQYYLGQMLFQPFSYDSIYDQKSTGFDMKYHSYYIPHYKDITPLISAKFILFGLYLALTLVYQRVRLPISPIIIKYILDENITLEDILPINMLNSFKEMENYSEQEFENLQLTMSIRQPTITEGVRSDDEHDLIENGKNIVVTKDTFPKYKEYLLNYLIDSRKIILDNIKVGFYKGLPNSDIKGLVDSRELMSLIVADDLYISKEDFERYVVFEGENYNEQKKWILEYFNSQTSHMRIIEFITGSSYLPSGGLQYLFNTGLPITISFMMYNLTSLPTAQTCFRKLHCPLYSNKDIMFKNLNMSFTQPFGFQHV